MSEQLRPLNLGEILDRTAQLYRRNFWLFVGTAALPLIFIFALAIPIGFFVVAATLAGDNTATPSPAEILTIATLALIAIPIYLAVYVYSYAGITQAAVSVYHGEKPTIRATLKSVHPRFWTYLWYLIVQGFFAAFIPMAVAMAIILPLIFFMESPGVDVSSRLALGFLSFLVAAAAVGVMIWLTLSYAMGMAACVVEKKSAWRSLVRSWRLSPGARGRIFVTYLLVIALAIVIGMALAVPLLILIAVLPFLGISVSSSSAAFVAMQVVRIALDFISQVLLAPVFMIAAVLFYFDQRIRKEGYDIEWMMLQAGLAPPQPQAASPGILGLAQPASAAASGASTGEFPPATPPDTVGEQ